MAWIFVAGKEDLNLEGELQAAAEASFKSNNFNASSLAYLTKLDRGIRLSGNYDQRNEILIEKLRTLCKYWDVDPTVGVIESHRKYLGPIIVKAKKVLFAVIRTLMKPSYQKQNNFNAQVVEILAELLKNNQTRKL